ncbi:Uncharacterized protein APZ42_025739 [Daphnia magna]|uniref:Uncharacterized protein n=1 Tax=Daphnia magna TaxID=35525 RepID=A0A164ST72_9CRUS|nr:Uncharacterized protein APZ42_025739 [Daphnia magna]
MRSDDQRNNKAKKKKKCFPFLSFASFYFLFCNPPPFFFLLLSCLLLSRSNSMNVDHDKTTQTLKYSLSFVSTSQSLISREENSTGIYSN